MNLIFSEGRLLIEDDKVYIFLSGGEEVYLGEDFCGIIYSDLLNGLKNGNKTKYANILNLGEVWTEFYAKLSENGSLEFLIRIGINCRREIKFTLSKEDVRKWIEILEDEIFKY